MDRQAPITMGLYQDFHGPISVPLLNIYQPGWHLGHSLTAILSAQMEMRMPLRLSV